VKAGGVGRVYLVSLVNRFGFTRHGAQSNGVSLRCACSTLMPGQEAFGRIGSAPTLRPGKIDAQQSLG
jgi:hypothetical protein